MSKPIRLIAVLLMCAVLLPTAGGSILSASAAPLATAPDLGSAASFCGPGWLDGDQYRPDRRHRRSGCQPRYRDHWLSSGDRRTGTIHAADAVALQAQSDVTTAYNDLAGQACNADLTGQDLGGHTLTPGVYCFRSSAQLTGDTHSRRPGQPQCGLHFQDREHAHDRKQLVRCRDQWRYKLQRVLAGRQLRDSRYSHCVRREYSRAHEHHPEYGAQAMSGEPWREMVQ